MISIYLSNKKFNWTLLYKAWFILIFTGWLWGCSYNTKIPPDNQLTDNYKSALDVSIKKGKIYKGLETLLLADVVYYSPQYIDAYRNLYFQDHSLKTPAEQEAFDLEYIVSDKYRFLIAVFSDRETWHELPVSNLGKGSIWTITLTNPAGEIMKPSSIKELENISEYLKTFGKFDSPWRKYYLVQFPKKFANSGLDFRTREAEAFSMKISSLHGFVEFSWYSDSSSNTNPFSPSLP